MWMNLTEGAFGVIDVVAGGPAAEAGIKSGDKILAIDGKSPAQLPLPQARIKLKSDTPGTEVRLKIESGGKQRDVIIILKDLI
jgi:C-terminal processing protease CtpA/Prc